MAWATATFALFFPLLTRILLYFALKKVSFVLVALLESAEKGPK